MATPDFDVGIIGGGPAGSSMAAYLAEAGAKVVVFERSLFPRPHVGESLVPAANRVLADMGLIQAMDDLGFPRKLGAVWTATTNSGPQTYNHDWEGLVAASEASIRFEERESPDVDMSFTWHVDRGKFDNLLLQRAHELGADVYEGVKISGVNLSCDPHVAVEFPLGRRTASTTVRTIVDASGRNTFLGKQLGLRVRDPVFDQFAIHTWFDNYDRQAVAMAEGLADYIFVHFLPLTNSWVWQIPITDTVTSIGVVTQRKNFAKSRESREAFFWECVGARPELREALEAADMIRPFKEEGDYSYAMKQVCGDGFVLIGDAARFVDPIFSSGVSVALNSAKLASQDILQSLEAGKNDKTQFANYETTIRRGTANWYRFITLYYRLNVLFTAYVNDPRYRLDVLKLLQGDVYDEAQPAILDKMESVISKVEANPNHPLHSALGDLTAETFRPTF